MVARSLFLSESQITAWPNVGVYTYDSVQMTSSPVSGYSPSPAAMTLYEVSVIGELGSWWLFTATTPPSSWNNNGGTEPLRATGSIPTVVNGSTVLRPSVLFWWIPADTLAAQPVSPTILSGTVLGNVPLLAPNNNTPSTGITVVQNGNNVVVTIPPQPGPTTVQIST